MIVSGSIPVVANIIITFSLHSSYIYIYIYIYIPHLLYPSIDLHLSCFHVLDIVNSAAMNIEIHVSFQIIIFIFSGYIPRSRIAGSYGNFIFSFLRNFHSVLHSGYTNIHSHQQHRKVSFSMPSPAFIICKHFDDGHSDWCKVMLRCSFDLYFSNM